MMAVPSLEDWLIDQLLHDGLLYGEGQGKALGICASPPPRIIGHRRLTGQAPRSSTPGGEVECLGRPGPRPPGAFVRSESKIT